MEGLGTEVFCRHPPSLPQDLIYPICALLFPCHCLVAQGVVISYVQYLHKNCQELFRFGKSFKTSVAVEEQLFRI